ncbi:MAG: hypothetical protein ABIA76_02575 [Candidatus Diapherotrites archaeon]
MNELDEVFESQLRQLDRKIKEEENEKNLIPTCSRCRSINITMPRSAAKVAYRELKSYYCRDCGLEAPPILRKKK